MFREGSGVLCSFVDASSLLGCWRHKMTTTLSRCLQLVFSRGVGLAGGRLPGLVFGVESRDWEGGRLGVGGARPHYLLSPLAVFFFQVSYSIEAGVCTCPERRLEAVKK